MVSYPSKQDFQVFIKVLQEGNYPIKRYLPPIDKEWYEVVSSCVQYAEHTSHYEKLTFAETCARLLYKVAKRHELGDGNKRSSVMVVFLFCLVNDYHLYSPAIIKQLAKRAASTKGRMNETIIRKRLANVLKKVIKKERY
jgi:death-on-curing family protein